MKGLPSFLLVILLFPLMVAQSAPAAERSLVLKEHLNQKRGREMVSYPCEAPSGQCEPKAVSLAGEFTVRAPEGWSLKPGQAAGVALNNKPEGYVLSVPAGTRAIELEKKKLPPAREDAAASHVCCDFLIR